MADKVAFVIESMIPELQHLERRGFFSTDEIKKTIQDREIMEYRMIKNSASKLDFLQAIDYELEFVI